MSVLADIVVTVHALIVFYVIGVHLLVIIGFLFNRRWTRSAVLRVPQLVCVMVIVVQALMGVECFLTVWERDLRVTAGQNPYDCADWSCVGTFFNKSIFYDVPQENLSAGYYGFLISVIIFLFVAPIKYSFED